MARDIDQIKEAIRTEVQATPELAAANSPSKRALWRLWTYIVAAAQGIFEQLQDNEVAEIETIIAGSHAGHPIWLQNQMLNFQYDATTPQIVQLYIADPEDRAFLSYYYPVVDLAKRIITRCSINRQIYNVVQIKVAKGTTPGALSALEIAAAQEYIDTIGDSEANYKVISLDSDKLYIEADVYYSGQYTDIQTTVEAAINAYLSALPFTGKLKLSDITMAIRLAVGVSDTVFKNIAVRADDTVFASKTYLVQNNTELQKDWQTVAGYVVGETDSGNTWADKINYIAI